MLVVLLIVIAEEKTQQEWITWEDGIKKLAAAEQADAHYCNPRDPIPELRDEEHGKLPDFFELIEIIGSMQELWSKNNSRFTLQEQAFIKCYLDLVCDDTFYATSRETSNPYWTEEKVHKSNVFLYIVKHGFNILVQEMICAKKVELSDVITFSNIRKFYVIVQDLVKIRAIDWFDQEEQDEDEDEDKTQVITSLVEKLKEFYTNQRNDPLADLDQDLVYHSIQKVLYDEHYNEEAGCIRWKPHEWSGQDIKNSHLYLHVIKNGVDDYVRNFLSDRSYYVDVGQVLVFKCINTLFNAVKHKL